MTARKSFFQLTAEDLMSHPVRTIPQDMPLRDAARLLSQARVTGAPVVDAAGRCVGVLSASDFVRWAEQGGQADKVRTTRPASSDWDMMELEFVPRDEVRWHMTADPVTAAAAAPIVEVAALLLDANIHRVFVVDVERKPIGVVSAIDIVAAVAHAASVAQLTKEPVSAAAVC